MLVLAAMVALLASVNPAKMAGPLTNTPPVAADYFASLLAVSMSTGDECACSDLTWTDGAVITTTRASSAYCTKSDGVMVLCANNKPRASAIGLLVEEGRTNLVPRSHSLNDWTCTNATTPTADTAVSPTGATDAEVVVGTGAGGYCESPSFTISGTTAAISAYVQATAGTQAMAIVLRDTTAGADRCSGTVTANTTWSTYYGLTDNRVKCAASGTVVSGNTHVVRIYPGGVAGTGTVRAWGVSAEAAPRTLSYIPTTGTSAARAADNINFAPGTAIASAGCFGVTVTFPAVVVGGARILESTASASIPMYWNAADTVGSYDGTTVTSVSTTTSAVSRTISFRAGWSGAAKNMEIPGGLSTNGAFDGSMNGATFYLGSAGGSAVHLNGYLNSMKLGTVATGCQL